MSDRQQSSGQTTADGLALRKRAEDQVRTMEPTELFTLTPEAIQKLLHDLQVHQIELEIQNEELRTAQNQIEAERARYFDLYDLAPVGYCTLSDQGRILEANLTAATLLGTTRGELVKQSLSHYIFKDDQDIYYLHRKRLFASGEAQDCELRLVKSDGSLFWTHLTETAVQAEESSPVCLVVLSNITERKLADERISRALKEKNVLLREIQHRVKNNLQIIHSLLHMQTRRVPDPGLRTYFSESRDRINAIALVHAQLYQSVDLAEIDFQGYLQRLVKSIASTYPLDGVGVTVTKGDPLFLNVNISIPCGLIVNELVTNSFRHAFVGGRRGTVQVSVSRAGDGNYRLTVSDNGIGLPANFELSDSNTMGLKLVKILAEQLAAEMTLDRGAGTFFSFSFAAETTAIMHSEAGQQRL